MRAHEVVMEHAAGHVEQFANGGASHVVLHGAAVLRRHDEVLVAQHGQLLRHDGCSSARAAGRSCTMRPPQTRISRILILTGCAIARKNWALNVWRGVLAISTPGLGPLTRSRRLT